MILTPKKYVIAGFVLVLILAGLFYKVGYLPVVGGLIANEKIEHYKSEVYRANDIENTRYNPKSGMYETIDIMNQVYHVSYNLTDNYLRDEYQINLWNDQLKLDFEKVKTQMPKNIRLDSPSISGYIDENEYSNITQRMYLSIYNEEHLTVEESEKKAAELTMSFIDLLGDQYNITGVQIWYFDRNGGYTIEKLKNNSSLSYDLLLINTRKLERLGENELKWISELQ